MSRVNLLIFTLWNSPARKRGRMDVESRFSELLGRHGPGRERDKGGFLALLFFLAR